MPEICSRRAFVKRGVFLVGLLAGSNLMPMGLETAYQLSSTSNLSDTIRSRLHSLRCAGKSTATQPGEVYNTVLQPDKVNSHQLVTNIRDLSTLPVVSLNPNLGTRLDLPGYVGAANKMGMSWLSMYVGRCEFKKQPWLMPTYQMAASQGMSVLWIINPQHLVSEDQIEQMITPILQAQADYPVKGQLDSGIFIQTANEPDLKPSAASACMDNQPLMASNAAFWLDQNLRTCAIYNRRCQTVFDRLGGGKIHLVAPALHDTLKMLDWFDSLSGEGVNMDKVIYSGHSYGTALNTWLTGMIMRYVIGNRPFIFSEIGSQSADPTRLPEMFAMAQRFKPLVSIYHELLNRPNSDPRQFGWGSIDQITGKLNERFFSIREYNQRLAA